jgi:hypothetical protein
LLSLALRRKSLHKPFGISRAVRSALSSLWVGRRPIGTQNCLQIAKTRGIEASVSALRIPINLGLHCLPRLTAANAEGARQAREYIGRETNLAALAANAVCEFSCSRTTSQTLQETYTKVLKLGSGKTDREQDATTVYKSRLHSSRCQCEIVISTVTCCHFYQYLSQPLCTTLNCHCRYSTDEVKGIWATSFDTSSRARFSLFCGFCGG